MYVAWHQTNALIMESLFCSYPQWKSVCVISCSTGLIKSSSVRTGYPSCFFLSLSLFACCYCFLPSSYKFIRAGALAYIIWKTTADHTTNLGITEQVLAWWTRAVWRSSPLLSSCSKWPVTFPLFWRVIIFLCPCGPESTWEISHFLDWIYFRSWMFSKD